MKQKPEEPEETAVSREMVRRRSGLSEVASVPGLVHPHPDIMSISYETVMSLEEVEETAPGFFWCLLITFPPPGSFLLCL